MPVKWHKYWPLNVCLTGLFRPFSGKSTFVITSFSINMLREIVPFLFFRVFWKIWRIKFWSISITIQMNASLLPNWAAMKDYWLTSVQCITDCPLKVLMTKMETENWKLSTPEARDFKPLILNYASILEFASKIVFSNFLVKVCNENLLSSPMRIIKLWWFEFFQIT